MLPAVCVIVALLGLGDVDLSLPTWARAPALRVHDWAAQGEAAARAAVELASRPVVPARRRDPGPGGQDAPEPDPNQEPLLAAPSGALQRQSGDLGKREARRVRHAILAFDGARAMAHVHHLAEKIGPRPLGSEQEALAGRYIAATLEAAGWPVTSQDNIALYGTKLRTRNIIATHPLCRGDERATVILGAHYDSCTLTAPSPGANDNASGVAVLLELARVMRTHRLPVELRLVFFGGEERTPQQPEIHHVGSDAYVAEMTPAQRAETLAMLSVDMVGAGKQLSVCRTGYGGDAAMQDVLRAAEALGLRVDIGTTEPWSDHEAFELAGIPSAWLTRMDSAPHWHTAQDKACHVGQFALTQTGRLVIRFLYCASGRAGPV